MCTRVCCVCYGTPEPWLGLQSVRRRLQKEEEDEGVKCVGGDKWPLTSSLWISCFLFIVALECCPTEITSL